MNANYQLRVILDEFLFSYNRIRGEKDFGKKLALLVKNYDYKIQLLFKKGGI